jgi:hypothetical protein
MSGTSTGTAWLCANLEDMLRAAAGKDRVTEVERLAATARAGAKVSDQELEDLATALGGRGPNRRSGTLGRLVPDTANTAIYVCPLRLCAREEHRSPGGPLPVCSLAGPEQPLRAVAKQP